MNNVERRYILSYILKTVPQNALYEALSEELCELAKVLLKKNRVLGNGNPTPVTEEEVDAAIVEETTDVMLCLAVLDIQGSKRLFDKKLERWYLRLKEQENQNE